MDQIDFPTGYGMNANTQFVYLTPPPIVRQYGSSHTDVTNLSVVRKLSF